MAQRFGKAAFGYHGNDTGDIDSRGSQGTGNHKIFVGNLQQNTTKDALLQVLKTHLPEVQVKECWVAPAGNFGFCLLDWRYNVLRACQELDGTVRPEHDFSTQTRSLIFGGYSGGIIGHCFGLTSLCVQ